MPTPKETVLTAIDDAIAAADTERANSKNDTGRPLKAVDRLKNRLALARNEFARTNGGTP